MSVSPKVSHISESDGQQLDSLTGEWCIVGLRGSKKKVIFLKNLSDELTLGIKNIHKVLTTATLLEAFFIKRAAIRVAPFRVYDHGHCIPPSPSPAPLHRWDAADGVPTWTITFPDSRLVLALTLLTIKIIFFKKNYNKWECEFPPSSNNTCTGTSLM